MVAAEHHRSYQTVIARRFALPKRANTCPAVEPILARGFFLLFTGPPPLQPISRRYSASGVP
jgi:hypothetical protein